MLALAPLDVALPDLPGVQHLVFTSANGVRFLAGASGLRSAKAWCVGPSTAEAAREAGFADVHEGAGDAVDLAADLLAGLPEGTGGVMHVANEAAAGDLVARLKAGGIPADFLALYETRPADELPPDVEAMLAAGPACVLVHSAKAAAAFAWAAGALDQAIIVAISEAAAARCWAGRWPRSILPTRRTRRHCLPRSPLWPVAFKPSESCASVGRLKPDSR